MLVANVRLGWQRSVSSGIQLRKVIITKDGTVTTIEVGPEVSEYLLDVEASKSVSFRTEVTDDDGKPVSSDTYTFTLGDLIDPVPDTNLFHEVVSVREVQTPTDTVPSQVVTDESGTVPVTP